MAMPIVFGIFLSAGSGFATVSCATVHQVRHNASRNECGSLNFAEELKGTDQVAELVAAVAGRNKSTRRLPARDNGSRATRVTTTAKNGDQGSWGAGRGESQQIGNCLRQFLSVQAERHLPSLQPRPEPPPDQLGHKMPGDRGARQAERHAASASPSSPSPARRRRRTAWEPHNFSPACCAPEANAESGSNSARAALRREASVVAANRTLTGMQNTHPGVEEVARNRGGCRCWESPVGEVPQHLDRRRK